MAAPVAKTLADLRVLVVEDNYLVAVGASMALEAAGATVVAMVATVEEAMAALEARPSGIDWAVLDINLDGTMSYPLADALAARGIPYLFTTGYDTAAITPAYRHVPVCHKPYAGEALVATIGRLLG